MSQKVLLGNTSNANKMDKINLLYKSSFPASFKVRAIEKYQLQPRKNIYLHQFKSQVPTVTAHGARTRNPETQKWCLKSFNFIELQGPHHSNLVLYGEDQLEQIKMNH
jgi:hypothetical protein